MTDSSSPPPAARAFVRTEVVGRVGVLTLDRPDRLNAMSNVMDDEFFDALRELLAHPDVRCILWRAEGRAFSTGRGTFKVFWHSECGRAKR